MITSQDVVALYSQLENLGIKIWIDGGWSVDALLGKQTRPHKDLDIAIQYKDLPKFRECLEQQGYGEIEREEDKKWNFVLGDKEGREVDVHAFTFDENGHVVEGIEYPDASLTGTGAIDGHTVRCISPRYMVEFLAPWIHKWPEKYVPAVSALCEKFGIELPREYTELKQSPSTNELTQKISSLRQPGKTFLIAIDGRGGSGKSTLAAELAGRLPDTTIVHLDDFAYPMQGADRQRLLDQVILPLKKNEAARYQRYDWKTKKLAEWHEIKPGGIVIIEGVLVLHPILSAHYDFRVWIECHAEVGFERGLARDISQYGVDTSKEWKEIWMPEEKKAIEEYKPQEKADYVVNGERSR